MRLFGLVLLVFTLGMDGNCDSAAEMPLPAEVSTPSVQCFTTYFNKEVRAGFSPPASMQMVILPIPFRDIERVEWSLPGAITPTFLFFSDSDGGLTLEEIIQSDIQSFESSFLVRNEEIVLKSGQRGWLLAGRSIRLPDGVFRVCVSLVRNGRIHRVAAIGSGLHGTNDFDFLIGVARTLCAEEAPRNPFESQGTR